MIRMRISLFSDSVLEYKLKQHQNAGSGMAYVPCSGSTTACDMGSADRGGEKMLT